MILHFLELVWSTGEVEATFFRTFSQAANLRALLFDSDSLPGIQAVKDAFQRSFATELGGSLGTDLVPLGAIGSMESRGAWDGSKPVLSLSQKEFEELENCVHQAFPGSDVRNEVQITRKIRHHGVDFTTRAVSQKNSQVLFTANIQPSFGQIEQLLVHRQVVPNTQEITTTTYARIFRYRAMPQEEWPQDPFRRFPLLGTRLMQNLFEEEPAIVPISSIQSHIAVCKMQTLDNYIAVMSLDRVSHPVVRRRVFAANKCGLGLIRTSCGNGTTRWIDLNTTQYV